MTEYWQRVACPRVIWQSVAGPGREVLPGVRKTMIPQRPEKGLS